MKKLSILLIIAMLCISCNSIETEDSNDIFNLNHIDSNIVLKEYIADENEETYIFNLNRLEENIITIRVSSNPIDIRVPQETTEEITIVNEEVKLWFEGSFINFYVETVNEFIYLKGDMVRTLDYDKYVEIMEALLKHQKGLNDS